MIPYRPHRTSGAARDVGKAGCDFLVYALAQYLQMEMAVTFLSFFIVSDVLFAKRLNAPSAVVLDLGSTSVFTGGTGTIFCFL